MCGIVGICHPQAVEWIARMNQAQFHRGPDGAGSYQSPGGDLALAMRRLAIVDLSGGAQPMQSSDGRYVIVYNGEIYNAPELRRELEAAGERFASDHSDTEVLLKLLMRDGEKALPRLNGMFAFCLYDAREKTLLCARDRTGIKPFYYVSQGETFAFASEMKSLLKLPFVSREFNRQSLFDYLSLLYVPGEQSILHDVRRLAPGHLLRYRLNDGKTDVVRWWDLRFDPDRTLSRDEWRERIRDTLNGAVKRWCLSDLPVAVSLSGGLDSSAIAGFAAQSGIPVQAYSLGFTGRGEENWNELPLAKKVAEKWGLEFNEIILDPETMLDDLDQMVSALDEPYGGGLPSWFVFKGMRDRVKVSLSGTGGDEMFGNYGKWRGLEGRGLSPLTHRHRGQIDRQRFRTRFFDNFYYFTDAEKKSILLDGGEGRRETSERYFEAFRSGHAHTVRDGVAQLDISTQLCDEFLLMTDRFSMAHGIEARTPFLDNEFVDLVRAIPSGIRTRRNDLKGLLRDAVSSVLPPELLRAPKKGFVIPLGAWMRGRLRPMVEDLLGKDHLKRQGIFAPALYDNFVLPHLQGAEDHTSKLWSLLMFQLWQASMKRAYGQP